MLVYIPRVDVHTCACHGLILTLIVTDVAQAIARKVAQNRTLRQLNVTANNLTKPSAYGASSNFDHAHISDTHICCFITISPCMAV